MATLKLEVTLPINVEVEVEVENFDAIEYGEIQIQKFEMPELHKYDIEDMVNKQVDAKDFYSNKELLYEAVQKEMNDAHQEGKISMRLLEEEYA
ncbi:MAG TPA: hypothetical protein DEP37_01430 [Algoriphagus sp.]|nr:hypothetical protein [Algoriphagus sp.]|tara:strand:+ start:419 stop:700 length:282 start_codon:yes stop_codon:yes gene_type:complete